MFVRDFVEEYNNSQEGKTMNMTEYGGMLLVRYANIRRRNLITLKEYVQLRNAIEEQLFRI